MIWPRGSKGSGFASALGAVGRYYREWAEPWERQTLTRARLVGGDPRVGRAVRRVIRDVLYGADAPPPDLAEMRELRGRMERELGKESPGRLHVKFGRGGLVDVEFITQAIVMTHGARHPSIRRANTISCFPAGTVRPAKSMLISTGFAGLPSIVTASSGVSFSDDARKNGALDSVISRCSSFA